MYSSKADLAEEKLAFAFTQQHMKYGTFVLNIVYWDFIFS
jgi:hypothetical protein